MTDELRQGDLIVDVPFPRVRSLRVDSAGVKGNVRPSRTVVVLDRCCTVQQKHAVTLAEVIVAQPSETYWTALRATMRVEGEPYAVYEHLIDAGLLPQLPPDRCHVIKLLDRFSFIDEPGATRESLRSKRVGRMTPLGRAHLRAKLTVLYTAPEQDDRDWLLAHGYDMSGRGDGQPDPQNGSTH